MPTLVPVTTDSKKPPSGIHKVLVDEAYYFPDHFDGCKRLLFYVTIFEFPGSKFSSTGEGIDGISKTSLTHKGNSQVIPFGG